jgi:hypothetical protein
MAKSTKPSPRKRASKKSLPPAAEAVAMPELAFKLPEPTIDPTLAQLARQAIFREPTLAEIDAAWD